MPGGSRPGLRTAAAIAAVIIAGLIAYHGTLSAPFVFDDSISIVSNPSIRRLSHLGAVLSPPSASGAGVGGRPLVNLSLALNYACGGLDVRGYHALNLAIHILAGLTLFGILRRTLKHGRAGRPAPPSPTGAPGGRALPSDEMAFAAALLWTVHPLLTESVTCVTQRTESMMGLFYLLTLYCFIRYAEVERVVPDALGRPDGRANASGTTRSTLGWAFSSVAACCCGMATKEAMVTAPVIVLLYDRGFITGSFAETWRARRGYYLGLAATWLLLAFLVVREGFSRGPVAGFGLGVTPWNYFLTQCWAIPHYLRLAFWPHPLIVDYGRGVITRPAAVLPQAILLLALAAGTVWCLLRVERVVPDAFERPSGLPNASGTTRSTFNHRLFGFAGAWFFIILAPSSTFLPLVSQTVAEHRMYLPLAAVIAVVVVAVGRGLGRALLPLGLALAVPLTWATVQRNRDYRSPIALWTQTAEARPENLRARDSLGFALNHAGRSSEAAAEFQKTLRRDPNYGEALYGLGVSWRQMGRLSEAVAVLGRAEAISPSDPDVHYDMGMALAGSGRLAQAVAEYEQALRLRPESADVRNNLGAALASQGRVAEAMEQFREALRLDPGSAKARENIGSLLFNRGNALANAGRYEEAAAEYQEALRLRPDFASAHENLGYVFQGLGRNAEAAAEFKTAARLEAAAPHPSPP